jgi:hypothetical protein
MLQVGDHFIKEYRFRCFVNSDREISHIEKNPGTKPKRMNRIEGT